MWDAKSGQLKLTLDVDEIELAKLMRKDAPRYVPFRGYGARKCVAFSPNGKLLAWGFKNIARVCDATSGQVKLTLKGIYSNSSSSLSFSPDGKWLATHGFDSTVRIWDVVTGQVRSTLHTGHVDSVTFSPDGKRLASSGSDGTVTMWDPVSGQETLTLKGTAVGQVSNLAFSRDGMRLAYTDVGGTIMVRDARPWTPELRAARDATIRNAPSSWPFNPLFCDLNRIEYQQVFDRAVKQRLRLSKLITSVADGEILYSGAFISPETPNSWICRSELTTTVFDQIHKDLTSKGYKLECHTWVIYNDQKIHVAIWVMK